VRQRLETHPVSVVQLFSYWHVGTPDKVRAVAIQRGLKGPAIIF
jgi:hypothetical protein